MISLNLLPDVKKDLLRVRRERNLVISVSIIAVVASIAILVVLGASLITLTALKAKTEGDIDKNEAKIKQAQEDKELNEYLTVQNQLSQIGKLKNGQMIYSRLLSFLTQLNPAEPNSVSIRSVKLSAAGSEDNTSDDGGASMTIEGRTSNFSSLDVYKNTLEKAQLTYEEAGDDSGNGSDQSGDQPDEGKSDDTADKTTATKVNLFTSVVVRESSLSSSSTDSGVSFTIVVSFNTNAFSPSADNVKLEVPKETTSDGDRNAPKETFHTDAEEGSEQTTEGGNE